MMMMATDRQFDLPRLCARRQSVAQRGALIVRRRTPKQCAAYTVNNCTLSSIIQTDHYITVNLDNCLAHAIYTQCTLQRMSSRKKILLSVEETDSWMGDFLQRCKPSQYVTSYVGQISLAISPWLGALSISDSRGVNRHTVRCTSPISLVW